MKTKKLLMVGLVGVALSLTSCGTLSNFISSTSSKVSASSSASNLTSSDSSVKTLTLEFGEDTDKNSTNLLEDASFSQNGIKGSYSSSDVYQADIGFALKFGSPSKNGSLVINFENTYYVNSVSVYVAKYSLTEAMSSLTVSGDDYSETAYIGNNSPIVYNTIGETDSLTFQGSKRFYVQKIEINLSECEESSSSSSTSLPISGDSGYYDISLDEFSKISYANTVAGYDSYDVFGGGGLPSVGSPKLLVVPLYFADNSSSEIPDDDDIDILQKTFFGAADETGYESLNSYYKKSSYGKLDIKGSVTQAYKYNYRTSVLEKRYNSNIDVSGEIVKEVTSWAKNKGYLDSSYDTNGDGYYDGIEIIYFLPSGVELDGELWWAFTGTTDNSANVSNPTVNRYFWSPIDLIETGYYSTDIDAHTVIHETGHMLGLDDYYSYDYKIVPALLSDMMDGNVGDHDAFSKMLLGWASPRVVTGEGSFSITLHSFTETGEFLLIPAGSYNDTVFDEYVILQYYTPTGLNKNDSDGYQEWKNGGKYGHAGTYAISGLQAFHVDARLYSYKYNKSTKQYYGMSYASDPSTLQKEENGYYVVNGAIAASNTSEYSLNVSASSSAKGSASSFQSGWQYYSNNKLIVSLPANGSNEHLTSYATSLFGDPDNLFTENGYSSYTNSKFKKCYQNNGKFNNGATFPYSFTVSDQTDSAITVNFTHI